MHPQDLYVLLLTGTERHARSLSARSSSVRHGRERNRGELMDKVPVRKRD